jgi:predicted phage terminase large subunit-like protein
MTDMTSVLAAIYRYSLLFFAERTMSMLEPGTALTTNWHHRAIAYQLERCYRGENRRLIINQPPKTLKTHLVSVSYVAWLLMHDPSLRIAIICYDEALASTQLRKIRQITRSRWYCWLAPGTRIRKDKDTETLFETTAGGEVRALSVQGGITGHGFDFIIIDDPQKASLAHSETERRNLEELYASAIANRWRNPAMGVLVVVMQRLHVDDFTAFLLRSGRPAVHLSIPAVSPCDTRFAISDDADWLFAQGHLLEPDRLSADVLTEMRALQGEVHFMAQYMQAPLATGGRVVDRTWFKPLRDIRKYDYRVISIDPAFTENGGDFSAALVCDIVGDDVQLVHGEKVQHDYPQLVRWIRQLDQKWKPDVFLIETIGAGRGLRHYLSSFGIEHVATIETHSGLSKLRRMEKVSPKIEAGRIWLPTDTEWGRQFLNIIEAFPYGSSDDWPDALSQLLFWQAEVCYRAGYHRRRRFPPPPPPDNYPVRRGGMHYRRWDFD